MRHLHCIFSLITSLWDQTTNPADTNPNFFLTKIICYWLHLCNIKCKWITCSPHWTLQNIQISILQIFVFLSPFNKQKQSFGELEFIYFGGSDVVNKLMLEKTSTCLFILLGSYYKTSTYKCYRPGFWEQYGYIIGRAVQ